MGYPAALCLKFRVALCLVTTNKWAETTVPAPLSLTQLSSSLGLLAIRMIHIPSVVCERCGQFGGAAFEASPYATPTLEMLRQNSTLDLDTRHEIEDIIHKDDADISFLDAEMSKLQITLLDLERQRQAIQTRIDRNKAFLAPIRLVPVEILQQIFTFCFPFISTVDIKRLPFQVSHVSAHWRFVASTMPDLWNKIDLNIAALSIHPTREELDIYGRFVSLAHDQSGTRPITMSIAPPLSRMVLRGCQSLVLFVSRMASRFSGHWGDLSIDIDLFNLVKSDFRLTAVKRLALLDKPRNEPRCFLPRDMPRLTHLKLLDCSAPVARLINTPWSQITHFEALGVPKNHLVAALGQLPALTHAHFAPAGSFDAPLLQAKCLPHLRDLTLSGSQAVICDVVKFLTAPSLSRFQVIVLSGRGPQFQSLGRTLRAFIDRSSTPITHLGLQHMSAEDMKDVFEGLPTVASLDLSIQNDSNALDLIIRQLVWKTQVDSFSELDVTNLLPKLQMLTVRRKGLSGALPGIIQMIRSRRNGHVTETELGGHLPPARLHTACFRSMDFVPSLVQLHQLGIAIDCMDELRAEDLHHFDISTMGWRFCHNGAVQWTPPSGHEAEG